MEDGGVACVWRRKMERDEDGWCRDGSEVREVWRGDGRRDG